jgi:crotonobetainyl-CoA:carnitine CoA-transferase CaiB-like acyl-CoA transferase
VSADLPLQGLTIVDLSQGIAGPTAAMWLGRYGAEVIKVEPPAGDWSRDRGYNSDRISVQATAANLGKRSLAIDLKTPEGVDILHRLVARADVFIEGFRPGVIQRLGFGYEELSRRHEKLIYLSISGYGQEGPRRDEGAIDVIMQAYSGLMSNNQGQDGIPHRVGFFLADMATGLYALQSVLIALLAQRATGRGRYIDCSLLQSATALQSMALTQHSTGTGHALTSVPLGTFRTGNGWINLSVTKDRLWPSFCQAIGRDDLGADAGLATVKQRRQRAAEINDAINEALAKDTSEAWSDKLSAAGILNSRVNDFDHLFTDPQMAALGAISWIDQPELGRVAVPNPPGMVRLESGDRLAIAPQVGAHSREIMEWLGYGAAEIEGFFASGAAAAERKKAGAS